MAAVKKSKKTAKKKTQVRMERGDIIKLILADHMPLKKLIKVLKSEKPLAQRQSAFKEFAPLLISHAKPEEETLYVAMKDAEELRAEGFEGDVEHGLADQMVEEAKRTTDSDLWTARVKVLAELVEHHIKEEEEEMFPDFRKYSSSEERVRLGEKYAQLREKLLSQGGEDSQHEAKINRREHVLHATH